MFTPTPIPVCQIPTIAYYCSNPMFRDIINEVGLIPQPPSSTWTEENVRKISPNGELALFASLTTKREEIFEHLYDDDIYLIDLSQTQNTWYFDPHFHKYPTDSDCIIGFTRQPIPAHALTLIYKGTGEPTE